MELPDIYVPESLRPQEKKRPENTTYAIGYTSDTRSFGMAYGPTEVLQEMLDTVPKDEEGRIAVLIAFPGRMDNWESEGILYYWNNDSWVRNKGFNQMFNPTINLR
jgi:hypothetical protein